MKAYFSWLSLVYILCLYITGIHEILFRSTSLVAQMVKRLPTVRETRVQSLGWEDLLEKGMATHSSTLDWKIPWTEEPGRLQSRGVAKSRTRLSDFTFTFREILFRSIQAWAHKYMAVSEFWSTTMIKFLFCNLDSTLPCKSEKLRFLSLELQKKIKKNFLSHFENKLYMCAKP